MNPLPSKKLFGLALLLLVAAQLALAQNASNASNGTQLGVNGSSGLNASANVSPGLNASASGNANLTLNESLPTPIPLTPLEQELKYYVESSESSEVSNFTHEASAYTVVKVAGKAQMFLDSSYQAVTDEAKIRQLTASYSTTLPLPFSRSDFNSAKFEFGNVNASWSNCRRVFDDFVTGRRTCIEQVTRKLQCWVIYTGDFGSVFNISGATSANRYNIQNGSIKIDNATTASAAQIAAMDAQFDGYNLETLRAQLTILQNNTASLRAGYSLWSPAFSLLVAYPPFATDGGLNRCRFDSTALTNLEKALAVTGSLPSIESISAEIIAGTNLRYDKGQVKKLSSAAEVTFSATQKRYNSFKQEFMKVNSLEPSALNTMYEELSASFNAVKTAGNRTTATGKAGEFNAKNKQTAELLASSEASLKVYAESLAKINNASETITAAFKIFGQSDPRLLEMQKTVSELKANFELKEADLRAGRPVTSVDFQSLASNASNLSASAQNLQRRENEVDPVLVGGLVVLLLLIGGGVYFLKKFKKQPGA